MLRLKFHEFALQIEIVRTNTVSNTENRRTLFRAIHNQIKSYKNLNSSEDEEGSLIEGEAAEVHHIFGLVSSESGINPRSRQTGVDRADPVGNSLDRYKQLPKGEGRGDWEFTIAIYYWFHRDDTRAAFAKKIDDAVFGQPFHKKFNLTRDQFYFPLQESKQINLKSIEISNDPSLANLPLPREIPASIIVDGRPDIAAALHWKYNLTQLYGREDVEQELLDWAQSGNNEVKVRLLHGAGGSGKTRLAFEIADKLDTLQWNSGFFGRDHVEHPVVYGNENGVFLVIDYPEERMEFVNNLLAELWGLQESYLPIRVLLVSRLGPDKWRDAQSKLKHRFSVQRADSTKPLAIRDAATIAKEAAKELSGLSGVEMPALESLSDWFHRDELHCLPLFALAYGVHSVVGKSHNFELDGQDLLIEMARLEIDRVRSFARLHDNNEKWLERTLALSIFTRSGLGQDSVSLLADAGGTGNLSEQNLLDALSETPWQNSDGGQWHLSKLEPDRFAVAFLIVALLNEPSKYLAKWLGAIAKGVSSDFFPGLGRILYDLSDFSRLHQIRLETSILAMIEAERDLSHSVPEIDQQSYSAFSASLALQLNSIALEKSKDRAEKARLMVEKSLLLDKAGEYQSALAAADQAVSLWKALSLRHGEKHFLDLSKSLRVRAAQLSRLGRLKEASESAKQALGWFPERSESPAAYKAEYGACLLVFSKSERTSQDKRLAAGSALQAVEVFSDLYDELPEYYAPLCASALEQAAQITKSNNTELSRQLISRALNLRRQLSADAPEFHMELLGMCLSIYVDIFYFEKSFDELALLANEAVAIFEYLRKKKPHLFADSYSRALREAANIAAELQDAETALGLVNKAVLVMEENWEQFRDPYDEEFAMALSGAATLRYFKGDLAAAAIHGFSAIGLYTKLAKRNPVVFCPKLAFSKMNLATLCSRLNQEDEAVGLAGEAADLYFNLAQKTPALFNDSLREARENEDEIRVKFGLQKRRQKHRISFSSLMTKIWRA